MTGSPVDRIFPTTPAVEDPSAMAPFRLAPCTLVFNWTASSCTAAITRARETLAERVEQAKRDQRAILPGLLEEALAVAGIGMRDIDRIVVVTGPGSFTALRTTIAYAQGLGLALAVPVIGVSLGQALRASIPSHPTGRIWFAGRDRLGRVLLDRGGEPGRAGGVQAFAAADLPLPAQSGPAGLGAAALEPIGPLIIIGEAALETAEHLRARGVDVEAIDRSVPGVLDIALAAELWGADRDPQSVHPQSVHPPSFHPQSVRPLYVEPPAAVPSVTRSRPAPIP